MKIKKQIKESKKETTFYVEELGQSFDSEKQAKEAIEEYNERLTAREKDFLICHKILNYFWVQKIGVNLLLPPRFIEEVKRDTYLWDGLGKNDKLPVNGLTSYHYSDENYSPPKFDEYKNFITLLTGLTVLEYDVNFRKNSHDIQCFISRSPDISYVGFGIKEENYWGNEYLMVLSLKSAAHQLALKL